MRVFKNLITMAGILVLMALAVGCSTSDGDGGNIAGPVDETPEQGPKYYDVTFTVHRFYVNGDCDAGALEGDGELSYGIEVLRETAPGSGSYTHVAYVDATGYPKSDGTKYKRSNGENLNINKRITVGRLVEGVDYKLVASAIEWDGVLNDKKDSRMGGSPKTEVNTAGGSKLHYEHKMTLGSSGECQLFLYFDADETLVK